MNDSVLELVDELNRLHLENEKLRIAVKDGLKEGRTRSYLTGLGAGMAFTPLAMWLAWKLLELVALAASRIAVPAALIGMVAVCVLAGLVLMLCSEVLCRRARQLTKLILDSLDLAFAEEDSQTGKGKE